MTEILNNLHEAAVYRLPSELLIQIVEDFSVSQLVLATHVSRLWRRMLLQCPTLWARIDMVSLEEKALTVIPYLLPRSQARPLDISMSIYVIWDPNYAVAVDAFYLALAPHVHRLRRLSWRCWNYNIVSPLFVLLCSGAPILESLHLVLGGRGFAEGPAPPKGAFMRTPRLSCVRWDGFQIPVALGCLSNVVHLRISRRSLPGNSAVFEMFPHARSIRVDGCKNLDILRTIPTAHPVAHLELSGDAKTHHPLSWRELRERRCTEVPVLVLRNYSLAPLFAACHEGVWRAESLAIRYADKVDAVLRHGARECRMISLGDNLSAAGQTVQRLMHDFACLRAVERLEMTLPLMMAPPRVPQLCMRALTTLVVLCARGKAPRGALPPVESLFNPHILAMCGTLRAPNLMTLVLKHYPERAEWQDPEYDGVVDPAALAEFIGEHIQLADGGLLPELRIDSPKVRLADDADGRAALSSVVRTIVHGP